MLIPSQRHLFDIPDDVAYLNCAYMSPLMHSVMQAGRDGIARKGQPWTISQEDFFTGSDAARARFARLVNARGSEVAVIPAASYGIAVAAKNLPLGRNQEVLILAEQFPSNVYAWQERAREESATVVSVDAANAPLGERVLDHINRRTAIVALPHCRWTDGALLDLEAIGARCREVGAALVLDVTQSAGALPLDVNRVQPDFLIAACYKWLMGPYSLGFMYVDPRWHEGRPLEHSWIARAGSEDFSALVDYRDELQPGAQRFDMGERANFHLMPMASAAFEQILDWGVENIAETLRARTDDIVQRCEPLGLRPLPGAQRPGHYLGLRREGGLPADLLKDLARHQVYLSMRGESLRITPHVFNTDADVERLLEALDAILT